MDDRNLYKIVFDQDSARCNDFISGYLIINSKFAEINSVKFQFWEISQCLWVKKKAGILQKDKNYSGKLEILHVETLLTFCEELAHTKKYYFRAKIPPNLSTSSWEGTHGFIKYFVRILVDFQGQTKLVENEIFIKPYRNLKLERHLLNESREDVNHTFSFTLLNLGSVTISIWLPVSGVARGQSLPLLCTIKNNSSTVFNLIMFILKQNEIYTSNVKKFVVSFDLLEVRRKALLSYGIYEYYCLLETDKKWHPTMQCVKNSCCQLTYDLSVKIVSIPCSNSNGDLLAVQTKPVPIIIGTEPLLEWNSERITNELTKESLNKKNNIEEVTNYETESEICTDSEITN